MIVSWSQQHRNDQVSDKANVNKWQAMPLQALSYHVKLSYAKNQLMRKRIYVLYGGNSYNATNYMQEE
jgi:hypothetical protein